MLGLPRLVHTSGRIWEGSATQAGESSSAKHCHPSLNTAMRSTSTSTSSSPALHFISALHTYASKIFQIARNFSRDELQIHHEASVWRGPLDRVQCAQCLSCRPMRTREAVQLDAKGVGRAVLRAWIGSNGEAQSEALFPAPGQALLQQPHAPEQAPTAVQSPLQMSKKHSQISTR